MLLAAAAALLLLSPLGERGEAAEGAPACAAQETGPPRTVVRIVDAETVLLDDGAELRLVGALAPRAIDVGAVAGTWPMEVAALAELRALLLGKTVGLVFAEERTDRYGRLQALVVWQDGDRKRWAQAHMLEQGLARAYVARGMRACADALLGAERGAREQRHGLWAEAAYQVRQADRPGELLGHRGSFQVVQGRVTRVGQGRAAIYLNFGREPHRDFSVSLRRGDAALLGAYASQPKKLEGLSVRGIPPVRAALRANAANA